MIIAKDLGHVDVIQQPSRYSSLIHGLIYPLVADFDQSAVLAADTQEMNAL